ncbi:hypothetical protein [Halorubellus sp. PRR65]|uniref:hypothetical protein n=1 Tax=Halorubellus sp. PRR65 TaxID=3098148 RepID=UPI002B260132|nr:hypothetical protein [Halorubellus sp. PRR65]
MTSNDGDRSNGDDDGRPHGDRAVLALAREDWRTAADAYVQAAFATFAGYEGFGYGAFGDRTEVGVAVAHLCRASVCHRLADATGRAQNRAAQGALVAADAREHVATERVDEGACEELVGVCRVLADDPDAATAAFDRARDAYADADVADPAGATTRPVHQAGTDLLTHLSRPDDVAWDDVHGTGGDALARRVRFLRSKLPEFVDARVRDGKLHAARASTEYNTGYRCPACDATDVNYHSPAVLCLRCSAVVEAR